MRGGAYRHRVLIESYTEVVDSFGQAIKTWATFANPFAAVEPLNGTEYFLSESTAAETNVRIRMRYQAGINKKMRVTHDGKFYNIEAIIDKSERNRELHLMCSEGLNDG